MLIKFIFVLWLFAIPFHEGISSNIRIIEDCNYDGNDISNVNITTANNCSILCSNDNLCTHFTWVPTSYWRKPVCFLKYVSKKDDAIKSFKDNFGTSCGLIISKFKISSHGDIQSDCDYQGMDVSNEITDSVEICKDKCSNDILCTHFTWVPNWKGRQSMCFLKYAATKDEATKNLKIHSGMECGLVNGKFGKLSETGISFQHNCYYSGKTVDQQKSLTAQQCLLGCSNRSNCTHFTWSPNAFSKNSICYYKYDIAPIRKLENDLDKCGIFVSKRDNILISSGSKAHKRRIKHALNFLSSTFFPETPLAFRYNFGIGK